MNAAAKKQLRDEAIVEQVEICHCTNSQLERGERCGLDICPNRAWHNQGEADESRHPRLYDDGEAVGAVPTVEGRVDDLALGLLTAHPDFDRDDFAWVGSEHLGGGIFCASLYTGSAAESPYLWVTQGEEGAENFLACVYVGGADGEEPEDPFLVAECGVRDLAAEAMRMLDSAGKQPDSATTLPAPNAGQGKAIEQSVLSSQDFG